MAESGVIREFLVSLGFKIDAASQKKFVDGIDGATKKTEKLAKANDDAGKSVLKFGGAILTVGALVGRSALNFAGKLEDLHFEAKRTGAAASSLKAMANAAQDVGVTAQEALSSVEGVARFMRNNPGGESYIQNLGVQTRKANGELRDTVDIVNDIGKELAKRPVYNAVQYGQMIGINENHLLGMRNQDYWTEFQKSREAFIRSGVDKQSDQAHGAMKWWRDLKENVEGTLGPTGTWAASTALSVGGGVLSYQAAKSIATKMLGSAAGAAAPAVGAAAGGAGAAGATGGWLSRFLPWLGKVGGEAALMLYSPDTNKGEKEELERRRSMPPTITDGGRPKQPSTQESGDKRLPRGIRNNNPGNLNYAGQAGATKESGPGGRFAVFKTAEEGLEALAVQIKRYANAGMDSIRSIVEKYAPKGENNTEAYIANVAKKFGVSDTTRLDFSNKDTLANMMSAITQYENGRNPYTRDMIIAAAAKGAEHTGKFGGPVKFEQKTEIKVIGASEPSRVADEVARRQGDLNEDMYRNLTNASS